MSTVRRALIAVALLTTGVVSTESAEPSMLDALLGSRPAVTLDGQAITRDDLRGTVVLVDVWATWCAPCLAEIPTLRDLHATHGARLRIIGVNVDSLSRRELRQWLARRGVGWPQLHDGRGLHGPLAAGLGVEYLPRTFLYDRQGRLIGVDLRGQALRDAVRKHAGAQARVSKTLHGQPVTRYVPFV